jgi:hypothetical protein
MPKPTPRKHRCGCPQCEVQVVRFACQDHWYRLTPPLRDAITRTFDPEHPTPYDPAATRAFRKAHAAAVAHWKAQRVAMERRELWPSADEHAGA